MKKRINILMVEDSPAYRKGIACALDGQSDMELIGEFAGAEFALRSLRDTEEQRRPDIVLLDLGLTGMSGLDAIPLFLEQAPEAKLIILTQSDKEADILSAISQGAAGYLLKSATVEQIKESIQTVMGGGASLDPGMAKYILQTLQTRKSQPEPEEALTLREMEVLTLLADGLVKKEIADKLDISIFTVATHVRHIYEKLEVVNAPAAISKAYRTGIFPRGER